MKNGVMRVSLMFTFFVLFVATLKGVTGDEYDHKVRETRNRLKMTREGICESNNTKAIVILSLLFPSSRFEARSRDEFSTRDDDALERERVKERAF